MKFLSLFSGIGGFDLGFERAGMKCVGQVEIDKHCQKLLKSKWPDAPKWEDVTKFEGKFLDERPDVICFGSPCQDLSIAGKRAGLSGERSGLFYEAIRIVRELEPAFAVWENVPGAFSSNDGRDFALALDAFRKCGARDIAWGVLDAQYFGVAQRRRRVFVVADFRGERAGTILFERESQTWNPSESRKARQETSSRVRDGVAGTLGGTLDASKSVAVLVGSFMAGQGAKAGSIAYSENVSPTLKGANSGLNQVPSIVSAVTSKWAKGSGGPAGDECQNLVAAFTIQQNDGGSHKRKDRPNGGMYVKETDTALTVGSTDFTGIVSRGVRRLMPIECERLQGFHDGHTEGFSDSVRYRMLGNAICVPVAEWIGKRIQTNH